MKKLEYYINILHYVVYVFCDKYERTLGYPADVSSGKFTGVLLALLGVALSVLSQKALNIKEANIYIFLFFFVLSVSLWFYTIEYKDKYVTYLKEFKKEPKEVKKKWAWISFGVIIGIILLLIFSFWI